MIKYANKEMKIVLFDTNCLSEIINNNDLYIKNLLEKFNPNKYVYAITFYNIIELYKRDDNSKKKMKEFLSLCPILLFKDVPEIVKEEYKTRNVDVKSLMLTSLSDLDLINNSFDEFFKYLDSYDLSIFYNTISEHINQWVKIRQSESSKWQSQFRKNIIKRMNEYCERYFTDLRINELNIFKSLEVHAYIRNEFIHGTKINIEMNSIVDSFNVAYTPYVDAFVTEKFIGKKLAKEVKKKLKYLKNLEVYFISDFKTN